MALDQHWFGNPNKWMDLSNPETWLLRNGDTDVENRLVDTTGEREGGMNGKSSIDIYTTCVK